MGQYRITNDLYHHGIKGQKWGVRRFQNKDGTLTSAGKKRYRDYDIYDVRNKVSEIKSSHHGKLKQKYMEKGFSEKEAELAASKRVKAEAYVAAAATVTVVAAVAYTKHKNYTKDTILGPDTELHRIMALKPDEAIRTEGRQYFAYKKMDTIAYKGYMGDQQMDRINFMKKAAPTSDEAKRKVYDVTAKAGRTLKVASPKRAKDTFNDLYKNDESFRKGLQESVEEFRNARLRKNGTEYNEFPRNMRKIANKLLNGERLTDAELKGKAYDVFNVFLYGDGEKATKTNNKFFDALKRQGMDAIEDMNDKNLHFVRTNKPLIMFDGNFNYDKRVLEKPEIQRALAMALPKSVAKLAFKPAMEFISAYSAVKLTTNTVKTNKAKKAFIDDYKQKHPNTELSDKEILALYSR